MQPGSDWYWSKYSLRGERESSSPRISLGLVKQTCTKPGNVGTDAIVGDSLVPPHEASGMRCLTFCQRLSLGFSYDSDASNLKKELSFTPSLLLTSFKNKDL